MPNTLSAISAFLVLANSAGAVPQPAGPSGDKPHVKMQTATDPITGQTYRYIKVDTLDTQGRTASTSKADWSVTRIRAGQSDTLISFGLNRVKDVTAGRAVQASATEFWLTLAPGELAADDQVHVTWHLEPGHVPVTSADAGVGKPLPGDTGDLKVTPGVASAETLLDGKKADTGQAKIAASTWDTKHRLALSTDSLVSLDGLDTASKLSLTGKYPFRLSPQWFSPAFVQADVLGNQIWTNASADLKLGFGPVVLPVPIMLSRETADKGGKVGYSPSYAPVFDASIEDLDWLQRDARVKNFHSEQNSFVVTANLNWTPVYIGRIFRESTTTSPGADGGADSAGAGTESGAAPEATGAVGAGAGGGSSGTSAAKSVAIWRSCTFNLALHGYWFPNDKATGGSKVRDLEGQVVASLVFPLPRFFSTDLQLSWTSGANEANNFVRSDTFAISFVARM